MKKFILNTFLVLLFFCNYSAFAETVYIHNDILGSPIVETNSSGTVTARFHYKPFGETLEGMKKGVGYTGHLNDKDLKLTYMQARYYDPVIGRFYSNDPIGFRDIHSFNRYAYAANNPYKFTDPTGEKEELAFAAGVGAGMSKEGAAVVAEAERSIGNDNVAGTIEAVSDIKSDIQSGGGVVAAIVGAVAKAAGVEIEADTPDNNPDAFKTEGKGKNKIQVHKETGVVMQENPAKHPSKNFNVWKNKKRFNKSKKRDTSVWADSGKDRGR